MGHASLGSPSTNISTMDVALRQKICPFAIFFVQRRDKSTCLFCAAPSAPIRAQAHRLTAHDNQPAPGIPGYGRTERQGGTRTVSDQHSCAHTYILLSPPSLPSHPSSFSPSQKNQTLTTHAIHTRSGLICLSPSIPNLCFSLSFLERNLDFRRHTLSQFLVQNV